jgi:tetratricopeptide (TPR) repeat protein
MTSKITFTLLIVFLQSSFLVAQTTALDSIKKILYTEKQDTSRVLLMTQLSKRYLFNNPDTAQVISREGLALSKKIGFTRGEALSMNAIANTFTYMGNYPKALELHLAALQIAENANDLKTIRIAASNIATDYAYQGNYQESIPYTQRALVIAQKIKDNKAIVNALLDLGDSYEKLNQLDSARTYTNKAYELAWKEKDIDALGIIFNNLGNIYSKMNQDAIALANYNSGIPYLLEIDNKDALCELYLGMAKLSRKAGKSEEALLYAKRSLAYGKKAGFTKRIMNASNFLTDYYISIHKIDSAFVYQTATIAAKDSLFSQEKQREIQTLTFNEAMRQQELQTTKANEEKQREHNIQYAIIVLSIITFMVVFLLLSRSIMVSEKWIRFLGILGLLLFFEFLNLILHPFISTITHHSPFYMLLIMVAVASVLIPLHHKIEHWIEEKMIKKNKVMRLEAAKKIMEEYEMSEELTGTSVETEAENKTQ